MVALTKPTAVIFDWDNTLVDTWPIIYAALVATFQGFGMEPWTLDRVKSNVKKSMRDSFPEVFGDGWERAAEIYQASYRATALAELSPLAGAEETLKILTQQSIPLFVVSNKKGDNLRKEITHLGWDHYFLNRVGAGDAAEDKPSAQPVLHAITPHGFESAAGMWFIGDSDVDLECAQASGCSAILFGEHAATQGGYAHDSLNGFPYAHYALEHADIHHVIQFQN